MYGLMRQNLGLAGFKNRVRAVFRRVGAHLAIVIGIALLPDNGIGENYSSVLLYLGAICLWHRDFDLRRNTTLFPLASSLGQLALCLFAGLVPPHMAIFLAGVQSFVQRAIVRKFRLSLDWVPAVLLLGGILEYQGSYSCPWGLMALTCVCGTAATLIARRLDELPELLRGLALQIEAALATSGLPEEVASRLEHVKRSCLLFSAGFPRKARSEKALLQPRLRDVSKKIACFSARSASQITEQDKGGLLGELDEINAAFARMSTLLKPAKKTPQYLDGTRQRFAAFYESVERLEEKSAGLPKYLQQHLSNIALYSANILQCMADPQDAQPGARFLDRYLPAVHKIVDEYIRLEKEGAGHREVEKVLGKMDEMLERMAAAFHEEHGSLLRNDAIALSAELNVLDKLLKMDGK